jgi:Tol biopolymer transport system component
VLVAGAVPASAPASARPGTAGVEPNPNAFYSDPAWSPDGKAIAFKSNYSDLTQFAGIYVMAPDGTGARRVTTDPLECGASYPCGRSHPTWSPSGNRLAYQAFAFIDATDVAVSGFQRLFANGGFDRGACCASWSPNGRQIAFVFGAVEGQGQLWLMNSDGSRAHRLAAPRRGRGYTFPTWSPDGKRIAFTYTIVPKSGYATGYLGIIRSSGRGPIRKIKTGRYAPWQPDWSRDGRRIVFSGKLQTIEVLDLRTNRVRRLHEGIAPSWSPDGKRIAFDCGGASSSGAYHGPGRICVMNADGSAVRLVVPQAATPVSAGGR